MAVTFDDGYADNLHNAKPALEAAGIPATFFVALGYVTSQREFWWDELEKILLEPRPLPEVLELSVEGQVHRWELGTGPPGGDDARAGWHVLDVSEPTPRQRAYRQLHQLIRPLGIPERNEVLGSLRAWADVASSTRPTHRPLSLSEVAELAQSDVLSVGAHTVNHPVLADQPFSEQEYEIVRSKSTLEDVTPVESFSYPYGGRSDYTAESVSIVEKAGFKLACATVPATVSRRSRRYELPRLLVRDWDGDEFLRRLRALFGGDGGEHRRFHTHRRRRGRR